MEKHDGESFKRPAPEPSGRTAQKDASRGTGDASDGRLATPTNLARADEMLVWRKEHKLTQAAFAELLGISRRAVQYMETPGWGCKPGTWYRFEAVKRNYPAPKKDK